MACPLLEGISSLRDYSRWEEDVVVADENAHHHAPGAGHRGEGLNTAAVHQHCRPREMLSSQRTDRGLVAGVECGQAMCFFVMTRDFETDDGDVLMRLRAHGEEHDHQTQKVAIATGRRGQNGVDSPNVSDCVAMKDFSSSC